MHDQSEPPGSPWRAALCAALFVAGGAYHLRALRALRHENGALRRAQAGKTAELALLRASDDRRFESYRAHVDALRTRHPRRRGNATAEHVPVGILVRTFAGDLQWLLCGWFGPMRVVQHPIGRTLQRGMQARCVSRHVQV